MSQQLGSEVERQGKQVNYMYIMCYMYIMYVRSSLALLYIQPLHSNIVL